MYLLDTDILSNLVRRTPSAALVARLAAVPREERFTSSITVGELFYGAHRREDQLRDVLLRRQEQVLSLNRAVLPFDAVAARRYGELRAALERRGTPLADADLRIAAIALSHGLIMVTGNVRHFQRIPDLTIENWLEG